MSGLISQRHCIYKNIAVYLNLVCSLIQSGFEDLIVSLIALNTNNQNEEKVGQLTIPMNRLNEQAKHEEWFDFYDSNGSLISLKILLNLQWIYSKVFHGYFVKQ